MKPITHPVLFYVLNFTWGLLLNLGGLLAALVMLVSGHKPHRWGPCFYFEAGENWGGCEWGIFFITNKNPSIRIRNHEMGHAMQNCYLGPIMPFLICFPSTIRYWTRRVEEDVMKKELKTSYDSIWFEGQATRLGYAYWEELRRKSAAVNPDDTE